MNSQPDSRTETNTPGSAGIHGFLLFLSFATLLLIVAGALVTSNDAGLSVPDWPTSFGSFRMPPMVGGVLYEHGHRMVAAGVGLLTLILTIWILWKDRRGWMKALGVIALLAVIVQGILGGITVRYFLAPPLATFHACLAQLFFALIVSLTIFHAPSWNQPQPDAHDRPGISIRTLSAAAVGVILLQLFLGAAFRHAWFNLVPHMVFAAVVTVVVAWTCFAVLRRFREQEFLVQPARAALGLLLAQLILGPVAYFLLSSNPSGAQPPQSTVIVTVAHVTLGALILAAVLVLTLRVHRVVTPRSTGVDS